jgi:hypothetical protein
MQSVESRDCADVGLVGLDNGLPKQVRVITRCTTCSKGVTGLGFTASGRRSGIGNYRAAPEHRRVRADVIHQVRCRRRHASGRA